MFRLLLGALFFFSSVVPAFAQAFDCTWCRGHGMHYPPPYPYNPQMMFPAPIPAATAVAPYPGGLAGAAALAIIFPGLIMIMTMATRYFMGVANPGGMQDEPKFMRNTAALSALWLLCFYPFLSTALGGFLFLVTGFSCVGGWIIVRRLGVEMKLWERLLVLWSFFFFSLVAGVMAAAYGRDAGAVFGKAADMTLMSTVIWGPFLLAATNAGALYLGFRIIGVRAPSDPETCARLKVYGIIVAVAGLDTVVMAGQSRAMSWFCWPLLVLPGLAYYGVYWLVARLPDALRARASLVLFAALALFLTIVACFAAGGSAAFVKLSGSAVAFGLSVCYALLTLWQSNCRQRIKELLTLSMAVLVCALSWLAAQIEMQTTDQRLSFVFDTVMPSVANLISCGLLVMIYGLGVSFVLSRRAPPDARYAVAAVLVSFMLLVIACIDMAAAGTF